MREWVQTIFYNVKIIRLSSYWLSPKIGAGATLLHHKKRKQAVQGLQTFVFCVVNVNSKAVFEHCDDLKNLIILNILKEKLVIYFLVGSFYLKIV